MCFIAAVFDPKKIAPMAYLYLYPELLLRVVSEVRIPLGPDFWLYINQ